LNCPSDMDKLEIARRRISTVMAKTMDLYGTPPSIGMLYATLYFSEDPLTLDELKESMGMSKTSMSTGVRKLEENHFVNKVWQKGVRKDLYEAQKDFYESFIGFYCNMWHRELELNMEAIRKAEPELKALLKSSDEEVRRLAERDLAQLENGQNYYKWLEKLVKSLESGKIFDFIPKLEKEVD